ncbi:MAG: hypothetical protein AAGD35_13595 [Actinomycetota bacterium]
MSATETAFLLALVAMVAVGGLRAFGQSAGGSDIEAATLALSDEPTLAADGGTVSAGGSGGGGAFGAAAGGVVNPSTQTLLESTEVTVTGAFELDGDGNIVVPPGARSPVGSTATFVFRVNQAGQYKMRGIVTAPNGGDDSFWVSTSLDEHETRYLWDTRWGRDVPDFVNNRSNGRQDVVLDVPAFTTFAVTVQLREDNTRLRELGIVRV